MVDAPCNGSLGQCMEVEAAVAQSVGLRLGESGMLRSSGSTKESRDPLTRREEWLNGAFGEKLENRSVRLMGNYDRP